MQDGLLGGLLDLAREEELVEDHVDLVEVEDEVELAHVPKELIAGGGGSHAGESTRTYVGGRGAGGGGRGGALQELDEEMDRLEVHELVIGRILRHGGPHIVEWREGGLGCWAAARRTTQSVKKSPAYRR